MTGNTIPSKLENLDYIYSQIEPQVGPISEDDQKLIRDTLSLLEQAVWLLALAIREEDTYQNTVRRIVNNLHHEVNVRELDIIKATVEFFFNKIVF